MNKYNKKRVVISKLIRWAYITVIKLGGFKCRK